MFEKFILIIGEIEQLELSDEQKIEVNIALFHLIKAQMMCRENSQEKTSDTIDNKQLP